jgi:hypothetical protein
VCSQRLASYESTHCRYITCVTRIVSDPCYSSATTSGMMFWASPQSKLHPVTALSAGTRKIPHRKKIKSLLRHGEVRMPHSPTGGGFHDQHRIILAWFFLTILGQGGTSLKREWKPKKGLVGYNTPESFPPKSSIGLFTHRSTDRFACFEQASFTQVYGLAHTVGARNCLPSKRTYYTQRLGLTCSLY